MLQLGAFKLGTIEYVNPHIANKMDKYECPECSREVFLRQGSIRVYHFAHYQTDVPCQYFTNPSDSQIHMSAQMLLKSILETNVPIRVVRTCRHCKEDTEHAVPAMDDTSQIHLEYRLEHNGLKIADVAHTKSNGIACLFEIYHTHKTNSEARPEPWFEFDASSLIRTVNSDDQLSLRCIRGDVCDDCRKSACDGCGWCWMEVGDCTYRKDPSVYCIHNCRLQSCPSCGVSITQFLLYSHRGTCMTCAIVGPPNSRQGQAMLHRSTSCRVKPTERTNARVYLNVPFSQKDDAKQLGCRFDPLHKKWYIHDDRNNDTLVAKYGTWVCGGGS